MHFNEKHIWSILDTKSETVHNVNISLCSAGQSESVRDVQFSIKDYFSFAASFENGNVQLWDIRRPDRYERMFTAHTGPVFCCDWHPEDKCVHSQLN